MKRALATLLITSSLISAGMFLSDTGTAAVQPKITTSQIRDFARISFAWPESTYLTVKTEGTIVTIKFDQPVEVDVTALLEPLKPYVAAVAIAQDGKEIKLSMTEPYRVRSFVSGKVSGVDLLGVTKSPQEIAQAAKAAEPKKPPKKVAEKPASETPAKPEVKTAATTPTTQKLNPTAGEETFAATVPPSEEAPKETAAAAPAPTPAPAPAEPAKEPVKEAASPTPPAPAKEAPKVAEAKPEPKAEPKKEAAKPLGKPDFKVRVTQVTNGFDLHFPWADRVGVAAFVRGSNAWIVFSDNAIMDLAELQQTYFAFYQMEPEQIPLPNATVLRIPVQDNASLVATRSRQGFEWVISLTTDRKLPENKLKLAVNTDPPLKPFVFLPAQEVAEPIIFKDPDIGDELIVIPSFQSEEGVNPGRDFVDFRVFETGQGIVIQKISDETQVAEQRNGVRISTDRGATLTAGLPDPSLVAAPAVTADGKSSTLFPYEQWKPADPHTMLKEIRTLMQEIVAEPDNVNNNDKRLRMAEMYLSQGYAAEALGHLNNLKRIDPQYYVTKRLSGMSGVANFMLYRFNDANKDFSVPELESYPEIKYWKSMTAELLGTPDQVFDYNANNADYISKYPPMVRQRLAIVAADRAIGAGQANNALKILDELNAQGLVEGIGDYVNFLIGKVALDNGNAKDALETWKKIANDPESSPFVQARVRYSIVTQKLKTKEMPVKEAQEELERLQLVWRGDNLELATLSLLGGLYEDEKNWPEAMRIWSAINTAFPNTLIATEVSRKMITAFAEIFANQQLSGLSVAEQAAFYLKYKDLTPSDSLGDKIVGGYVDNLIALDLLEEAAKVLEQRMRFRYEREERSAVGAKLSEIYLKNHKPELALAALQNSTYGNNSSELVARRDVLAARALIELKKYDSAMELLKNNTSEAAYMTKLDVLWAQKEWLNFVSTAEDMLKARPDPTLAIEKPMGVQLVRLALAYNMTGDDAQLQYLRDYFSPLMSQNDHLPAFTLATEANARLSPDSFDEQMQYIGDAAAFLKQFAKSEAKAP